MSVLSSENDFPTCNECGSVATFISKGYDWDMEYPGELDAFWCELHQKYDSQPIQNSHSK